MVTTWRFQMHAYMLAIIQISIVSGLHMGYNNNYYPTQNYRQQYIGMSGTPVTILPKPYLPIEPPQPTAAVLSLARGGNKQQGLQKNNHVAFVGPAKSFTSFRKHHSRKTETFHEVNIRKNMYPPSDYKSHFQFQQQIATNVPTTVATYNANRNYVPTTVASYNSNKNYVPTTVATYNSNKNYVPTTAATYNSNNDDKSTTDSNGVDIYKSKSIQWYGPKVKSQGNFGQQQNIPLNNFGLPNSQSVIYHDNHQQYGDLDISDVHHNDQQRSDSNTGQQEYQPTLPSNLQQQNNIGHQEYQPTLPSNLHGLQQENFGQSEYQPTLPTNLYGLQQQQDNNMGQQGYHPTLPSNVEGYQSHQNQHNSFPSQQPVTDAKSMTANSQTSNTVQNIGETSSKSSSGPIIFSHREAMRRFKNRISNIRQASKMATGNKP